MLFKKKITPSWALVLQSRAEQSLLAFTTLLASFVKRADFIWFLLDWYLPHKSNLYSKYYLSGHGDMPKIKNELKKNPTEWGTGVVVGWRRKGKNRTSDSDDYVSHKGSKQLNCWWLCPYPPHSYLATQNVETWTQGKSPLIELLGCTKGLNCA